MEVSKLPYEEYTEKLVSGFMGTRSPYDLFLHNDNWGQMYAPYLEPLEGIYDLSKIPEHLWRPMFGYQGHVTVLSFVDTGGCLYYRTDLVPKPPET